VLRGGTGGDATTALSYINQIRTRPGDVADANLPNATKTVPGAIVSGQLTLDFILDERARELYWEGHRRTDLIRYGKYTGSTYLWPWKGGVKDGTSIEAKRALFPIPASDIGSNPNLKQNDGY
jgi:starch-binding outer membrane protein, SusD/RagB family